MQSFRKLIVWQKSHQLTMDVYSLTKGFPEREIYGLASQMRRASSSVPTNLAEGTGKMTDREFRKYVSIAFGSAHELEYLLLLSNALRYIPDSEYDQLDSNVKEVKKMLAGLIDRLSKRIFTKTACISLLILATISFFTFV